MSPPEPGPPPDGARPPTAPNPVPTETHRIWIDRRPMWRVVLARFRQQLLAIGVLGLFLAALHLPPPAGLDQGGYRALCLFGVCVVYWVSGLLPLSITSLVAMAGIPLLGVMPAERAYSFFGSPVVFFVLGAFILGAAVVGCGLSARLAVGLLGRYGRSPRALVYTVYFLCAGMSLVMSEHAVAAMMFPIVVELVRALGLRPGRSAMARALYFALAWGCIAGGTTTILGGGRGPLAIGFLEKLVPGQTIGFLPYILYDLPLVAVMLLAGALLLRFGFDLEIESVDEAHASLRAEERRLGKLTWREQGVAAVLLATILLWVTLGHGFGLANGAIVGVGALFILRLSTWREIEANVNWGILLTYGGAIALGAALAEAGTAAWLTDRVVGHAFESPKMLLLTIGAVVMILTEFMSNSAVIAIMMPAALALAPAYDLDPRTVTMAVVLPSNFAFMFPAATPATAMAWSSGTFTPMMGIRFGFLMDLAGYLGLVLLVTVYWPAIGLL